MYKYKALLSLLFFNSTLVFAVILCSGKGFPQLFHRQNFSITSGRNITINADDQAYGKGFTLQSFSNPSEGLCVSVDPYHFWQSGIEASVLKSTLMRNLKISINQQLLPKPFVVMNAGDTTMFQKTDAQGKVLGYYSAPFIPCFTTVFLAAGCYDVTIHEAGVFGQVEEYSFGVCIQKPVKRETSKRLVLINNPRIKIELSTTKKLVINKVWV